MKPHHIIMPPAGSVQEQELIAMEAEPEPKYSQASEMDADQWDSDFRFIRELEKRSMSSWSAEEIARYSLLTGQEVSDSI